MARSGRLPYSVIGLFLLALLASVLLRATKFGAHLYAVGGNAEGARLAGIRTDRVIIGAHVLCSLTAGLTGLYLASRLRSGAPWVGRDGVYDLESIAVVVIGGTLLAGGRGGVWGTLAGVLLFAVLDAVVQHARRLGLSEAGAARRDRHRRGRGLHVPLARARRMTIALKEIRQGQAAHARRINVAARGLSALLSRDRPAAAELSRTGRLDEFPAPRGAARDSRRGPALRPGQRRLRPLGRLAGHADGRSAARC